MPKIFKIFVHVLLVLFAFQVCNINVMQCYAGNDGGLDIRSFQGYHRNFPQWHTDHHNHKDGHQYGNIPQSHSKHKLVKKIFPAKSNISQASFVVNVVSFESPIEHYTYYPFYQYLYYQTYNPPPSC